MISAERNYKIYDEKLLAVVATFKEWRQYIKGSRYTVEVICDYENLKYFIITKKLNRR